MALTRKMLSAMDIPAEKIDEIISAHTETVNALKEERDKLQADIDGLKTSAGDTQKLQADLQAAKEKLADASGWEKKYDVLKEEYENFKADIESRATQSAKSSAYRKILVDAGISEKRIDSIMRVSVSEIDAVELDDDGNAKDADTLAESVKKNWADFITTTHSKGADVANPPENTGGSDEEPSYAAAMVAKFNNEHYGNPIKED